MTIAGRSGIISNSEKPFEKKESSESIDFREKKGNDEYEAWHATQASARSGAILDPHSGRDTVIRTFAIVVQKNSICGTIQEVLEGCLPMIKKNVSKDGWTFAREPSIRKTKKGNYMITTILRPAIQRGGIIIGAENASARSATDLLMEAAKHKKHNG